MILHFLCLDGKGDFLEFFLWRERFDLPKGSIQISAYFMDKASHLSSPRPGGEAGPSLVTQKNNSTMSQERFKGLRDQTLVLRVLVPGLHTSLNDKINSKNSIS